MRNKIEYEIRHLNGETERDYREYDKGIDYKARLHIFIDVQNRVNAYDRFYSAITSIKILKVNGKTSDEIITGTIRNTK